jgi:hypothetical protein
MSLDELDAMLRPRFSLLAFDQAIEELIDGKSRRAFAGKVGLHHSTLGRLISGEIPLTMPMLEAIAEVGKVTPFYFAEYRAMWVARAFTEVFDARPNLSIRAVKQLLGVREHEQDRARPRTTPTI